MKEDEHSNPYLSNLLAEQGQTGHHLLSFPLMGREMSIKLLLQAQHRIISEFDGVDAFVWKSRVNKLANCCQSPTNHTSYSLSWPGVNSGQHFSQAVQAKYRKPAAERSRTTTDIGLFVCTI